MQCEKTGEARKDKARGGEIWGRVLQQCSGHGRFMQLIWKTDFKLTAGCKLHNWSAPFPTAFWIPAAFLHSIAFCSSHHVQMKVAGCSWSWELLAQVVKICFGCDWHTNEIQTIWNTDDEIYNSHRNIKNRCFLIILQCYLQVYFVLKDKFRWKTKTISTNHES